VSDKIRVKLVRSPISTTRRVRETVKGLGLHKVGSERELVRNPSIDGMIKRLKHLVKVVEN
jgi:large subunit ribosomal protein L30